MIPMHFDTTKLVSNKAPLHCLEALKARHSPNMAAMMILMPFDTVKLVSNKVPLHRPEAFKARRSLNTAATMTRTSSVRCRHSCKSRLSWLNISGLDHLLRQSTCPTRSRRWKESPSAQNHLCSTMLPCLHLQVSQEKHNTGTNHYILQACRRPPK